MMTLFISTFASIVFVWVHHALAPATYAEYIPTNNNTKTIMTKKKESTGQERRNEFPKGMRLYDLVKKEYRSELRELVKNLRQWLIDGENTDWRKIKRIDIDKSKIKHSRRCKDENNIITKDEFIEIISEFLFSIGRGKGLNMSLEAFIRYLASPKHSNFGMQVNSLTTKIHRQLAYLESKKKLVALKE